MLIALPTDGPNIGADFEGEDLRRDRELDLVLLHDYVVDQTYILDVYHLQSAAFDTSGTDEKSTLRSILQSDKILKLFRDVREESDAIYHHFKVKLDGVLEVWLFMMTANSQGWYSATRYRPGLYKTILNGVDMDVDTKNKWIAAKNNGKALWNPDQDGSFDRFTDHKCSQRSSSIAAVISYICAPYTGKRLMD
jgi:exonuclease 3'-5' domain-containing protein 1